MDRLLAGSLVTATLGLLLLGILAVQAEPPTIGFHEAAGHEGHPVCLEGVLRAARSFESGAARLTLVRGNHSLAAFARFPPPATPGDHVRACGTIERTASTFELRLRTPSDLRVLQPWSNALTPVAELSLEPWRYVEQNVLTMGRAEWESQRGYLADEASPARIRILPTPEPAFIGERVLATGLIEYDAEESLFRLRIRTLEILDTPPGE